MSSQSGAFDMSMKTLLMNRIGSTSALTTAGAASAFGITPASASPRALKAAAATTRTSRIAGTAPHGTSTPYSSAPNAATMTTSSAVTSTAWPMRPARYAQVGSGVPRTRLRMPSSRAMATVIDRLVKVAVTTANTMIAGVKNSAAPSPNSVLKTNMNSSGKANVKNAAGGLRQKLRFS